MRRPVTTAAGKSPPAPVGQRVQIEVQVYLSKAHLDEGPLYISGNVPELGDWKPDKVPLKKITGRYFMYRFSAPKNTSIEFKISRGSWKTQAIFEEPNPVFPPANRVIVASRDQVLPLKINNWLDLMPVTVDPIKGNLKTHADFPCPTLNYPRDVFVWLPPSYTRTRKRYPVLYMHDGQNLFDPGLSFCGADWKVDETVTQLLKEKKVREFIVVGISNTPDRMLEYNYFQPEGKRYVEFVINELKPFIDGKYRTCTSARDTAVMGSSMGGLLSFQMGWYFPEVFGMAGCLSSAFYQYSGKIFEVVKKDPEPVKEAAFYLDTGEHEPPILKSYERMMALLKKKGYREGENLFGYYAEGATHSEGAWADRLHIPLLYFFPT